MDVVPVPLLKDNYAYLLIAGQRAAVVDPSEAAPVAAAVEARGLSLELVLNTHHHGDHSGGNVELAARFGCPVVGPEYDRGRLPDLSRGVKDGERVAVLDEAFEVLHVPGHTTGAVAFYSAAAVRVFTGDTLFSLGCGRMFEGTPAMMWASLARLAALPPATLVYSGHEYTEANARFALAAEPDNAALAARAAEVASLRRAGLPTVPSTLASELACNPFLRAGGAERFGELRRWKDGF